MQQSDGVSLAMYQELKQQLDRIETALKLSTTKEAYTVEDVAQRVGRVEWTVRQWCNKGQVAARKVRGKGRTGEWRISPDEVARLQAEGPAPEGTFDNGGGRISRRAA